MMLNKFVVSVNKMKFDPSPTAQKSLHGGLNLNVRGKNLKLLERNKRISSPQGIKNFLKSTKHKGRDLQHLI